MRGAAAGLHLVAQSLPRRVDITRLVNGAATRSVRLYPLSEYGSRDAVAVTSCSGMRG